MQGHCLQIFLLSNFTTFFFSRGLLCITNRRIYIVTTPITMHETLCIKC